MIVLFDDKTFDGVVVELPDGKMSLQVDNEHCFTAEKTGNEWTWNGAEIPNKNWVKALTIFERRKKLEKLLSQP